MSRSTPLSDASHTSIGHSPVTAGAASDICPLRRGLLSVGVWPEGPHSARVFALRTGDEVPPTNWKRSVDS
jgi:hypothetical protein